MEIYSTCLEKPVSLIKGIKYRLCIKYKHEILDLVYEGFEFCDEEGLQKYRCDFSIIVLEDHQNKKIYPITGHSCYDFLSEIVDHHNDMINQDDEENEDKDEDLTEETPNLKNNVYLIDF